MFSQAEPVEYESALERDFAIMCDWAPEVQHVRWEPFSIEFDDLVLGKARTYTPDFLVKTLSRRGTPYDYLVETKRKSEYDRIHAREPEGPVVRAWMAAQIWCRLQPSSEMVVITDDWLQIRGIRNVTLIRNAASYEGAYRLTAKLLQQLVNHNGVTLIELVETGRSVGFARPAVISTLLRLCFDDRCRFDVTQPLVEETLFHEGARDRVFRF